MKSAAPRQLPVHDDDGGMGIRTLQTLEKISVEPSQKTLFVLPADLGDAFKKFMS